MSWTALLPVKAPGARKTRLAGVLDRAGRDALAERMLARAIAALADVDAVGRVIVLSPVRYPGGAEWIADRGRGLNAELAAADVALGAGSLLVLLPDLALVTGADIAALLAAASAGGAAFAADRHGRGTNAAAFAGCRPRRFRFGADSRARFDADGSAVWVDRRGLAWDCDTPDDLVLIGEVPSGRLAIPMGAPALPG